MNDILTMGARVDTSEVKRAEKDFDNMGKAAEKSAKTIDKSAVAAKKAQSDFAALQGRVKDLVVAYASIQTLAFIGRTADEYTKLTAQLRIATRGQEEFKAAYDDVIGIARTSQGDLSAIGTLFARITNTTREAGVSMDEVARITEVVTLGLRVSGATAGEAASATLQLSQAFASGVLRGEEFNAVSEAAFPLMKALADSMGRPVEELREMAKNGELTRDKLVAAFADPELLEVFRAQAKEVQTISSGFNALRTELTVFIGELDSATGASKGLAEAMAGIAEFVRNNGPEITGFLAGISALALVAGIGKVTAAIYGMRTAFIAFSVSLATNPLGLIALGIGAAAGGLSYMTARTKELEDQKTTYEKIAQLEERIAMSRKALEGDGQVPVSASSKSLIQKRIEADQAALAKLKIEYDAFVDGILNPTEPPKPKPGGGTGGGGGGGKGPRGPSKKVKEQPTLFETLLTPDMQAMWDVQMMEIEETAKAMQDLERKAKSVFDSTRTPMERYIARLDELELLMQEGLIPDMETYKRAIAEAGDEFNNLNDRGKDSVETLKQAIDGAAKSMAQAFVDFAISGKGSFKDLVNSILADIARIVLQKQVTDPLVEAIGGIDFGSIFTGLFSGFANGGYVSGKGTSTSDSIPAKLSAGEYVVKASAVKSVGVETLNAINSGQGVGGSKVSVNIYNNASGTQASAQESTGPGGIRQIDVFIEQVEAGIRSNINKGRGIAPDLERTYGLNRAAGANS